jgi:hypothetical protein
MVHLVSSVILGRFKYQNAFGQQPSVNNKPDHQEDNNDENDDDEPSLPRSRAVSIADPFWPEPRLLRL